MKIVELETVEEYTKDLIDFFLTQKLQMKEIEDKGIQMVEIDNAR